MVVACPLVCASGDEEGSLELWGKVLAPNVHSLNLALVLQGCRQHNLGVE